MRNYIALLTELAEYYLIQSVRLKRLLYGSTTRLTTFLLVRSYYLVMQFCASSLTMRGHIEYPVFLDCQLGGGSTPQYTVEHFYCCRLENQSNCTGSTELTQGHVEHPLCPDGQLGGVASFE